MIKLLKSRVGLTDFLVLKRHSGRSYLTAEPKRCTNHRTEQRLYCTEEKRWMRLWFPASNKPAPGTFLETCNFCHVDRKSRGPNAGVTSVRFGSRQGPSAGVTSVHFWRPKLSGGGKREAEKEAAGKDSDGRDRRFLRLCFICTPAIFIRGCATGVQPMA